MHSLTTLTTHLASSTNQVSSTIENYFPFDSPSDKNFPNHLKTLNFHPYAMIYLKVFLLSPAVPDNFKVLSSKT